jgi:hypothetical protein
METRDVEKMALRAYEQGRMRLGAGWALAVVTLTLGAVLLSPGRLIVVALGLPLATLLAFGAFRGQAVFAGAKNGLLAGLIPLALALGMRDMGTCYSVAGQCFSWCAAGCAVGGVAASLVVAKRSGHWHGTPAYWMTAGASLLLTGSMACGCAGAMALASLGVGIVVGMVPAYRLAPA